MIRRALVIAAAAALATPAAQAASTTTIGPGRVTALAASEGATYAVLDANSAKGPFTLRRGRSALGTFGDRMSEFPDVAVHDGDVTVSWGVTISGGEAIFAAGSRSLDDPIEVGVGTGPPRLAAGFDGTTVAFPDRSGDVVVAPVERRITRGPYDLPAPSRSLTRNAPERRHLPLDATTGPRGVLVLDLVQTRTSTELRVLGTGAPSAPVLAVRGLRDVEATIAADARGVSVAYMSGGRAVLATSRGGRWSRRRLPGVGAGAPSVARGRGSVVVAYEQRRDVLAVVNGRSRVIARGAGTDRSPHAAVDPESGRAWIGWTHRDGTGRARGLLQRVR